MKKLYQLILLLLGSLLLLPASNLSAQGNTQAVDLMTVLKLGGANNLTIREFRQKQQLALADSEKASEWWLPDLYAGAMIHQLWGSAMNGDGRFFTNVNRQNFWGGAGVNASWDFGKEIYNERAERIKVQACQHLTQAERNKVLLEIIEAYFDFLTAQLYFNSYEKLIQQADTIANQINVQVEIGLRYESEYLLAKSNQSHLKVEKLNAQMEFEKKSAALVELLNLKPGIKLLSTEKLLVPLNLSEKLEPVMANDSLWTRRPEYRAATLLLRSLEEAKRSTTSGLWLPKLQVNINGSMFGDVISPLYPTSTINAALLWRIPLGRLTSGGELAQYDAKIALRQTQIRQVKARVTAEVARAQAIISTANLQMKIALEGSRLAQEALSQSMQRQKLGTVRPFEILQAQELYAKARLDYLKAVSTFNQAQYQLFVASGNDL